MKDLDRLASAARESTPSWDDARASRVLGAALDRRERRAARSVVARRALVIGSAAAFVGLLFLRGANASPSSSSSASVAETEPTAVAAAPMLGDAGYARD